MNHYAVCVRANMYRQRPDDLAFADVVGDVAAGRYSDAAGAAEELGSAGVNRVVGCNTAPNHTNATEVALLVATALLESK